MSYNGDVVAIGAPRNDGVAGSNTGHVSIPLEWFKFKPKRK